MSASSTVLQAKAYTVSDINKDFTYLLTLLQQSYTYYIKNKKWSYTKSEFCKDSM